MNQNTQDNIRSLYELSHSIKLHNKKRTVVCNGHFCDLEGVSEDEYLKGNMEWKIHYYQHSPPNIMMSDCRYCYKQSGDNVK